MAQFTLSVINNRGETVLTRYDAVTGETAGLTFDENFNINVDGATLSFAMLKYYYEGSQKVVNTAATTLIYGSRIKLATNGQQFMFNVQSISYQFMQENLQLNFSCIDAFQFETSKLGLGYTIAEDTTDPNYIGAQPIDSWANKIVRECGLRWQYVPIDRANDSLIRQFNNIAVIQSRDEYSSTDEEAWAERIEDYSVAPKPTNASLNIPVSFSCSNVNAYAALKELATRNELILKYDYATLNFWFVPQKNPYFKGYYFNPYNNLQAFSVAGDAQNLVTVLNVQGPKDYNDQEILLVPEFPGSVVKYIDTEEWKNSIYYSNLYIDNCATDSDEDDPFYATSSYTPWLENKLINIDYFKDSGIITDWEYNNIQDTLYNDLRIVNGQLIIQTSNYLKKYEQDYMAINQQQMDLERQNGALWADIDSIYGGLKNVTVPAPVPVAYPHLDSNNQVERVIGLYIPDLQYDDDILYSINDQEYRSLDDASSSDDINDYLITDSIDDIHITTNRTASVELAQLLISEECNSSIYEAQVRPNIVQNNRAPQPGDAPHLHSRNYFEGGAIRLIFSVDLLSQFNKVVIVCSPHGTIVQEEQQPWGNGTFTYANGQMTPSASGNFKCRAVTNSLGIITGWRFFMNGAETDPFYYYVSEFEWPRTLQLTKNNVTQTFHPVWAWKNDYKYHVTGRPEESTYYGALSVELDTTEHTDFELNFADISALGACQKGEDPNAFEMRVVNKRSRAPLLGIQSVTQVSLYSDITLSNFSQLHKFFSIKQPQDNDDTILRFMIRTADQQTSTPLIITNQSTPFVSLYQSWSTGNSLDLSEITPHSTTTQKTVAGLDERLTEIGSLFQTNLNLYAEYMYKFQQYWNKVIGNYTIGMVYTQLRKVGVLANNDDEITVGGVYSASCPTIFTAADKSLFEAYYYNGEVKTTPFSRTEIVKSCSIIASTLTEYWNLAYSAAMLLGIFCPDQWDCLDILEEGVSSSVYRQQLPLLAESYYDSTTQHWSHAPLINVEVIPQITVTRAHPYNYKYYNENREYVSPLLKLPQDFVGYSNTDNYYTPWDVNTLTQNTPFANYWGIINQQHRAIIDTDTGYDTKLKLIRPQYAISAFSSIKTLSQVIREWIAPAHLVGLDQAPISFDNIRYNPSISFIASVAQCAEYNDALYYELQKQRHDIWQHLYTAYPGVFRESNYVNQDAGTSQQLYNAAKAQLNMLSQPQFTYQLTGMDIYMHDSDYVPTRLTIGDQIHIDYQEDSHRQDTLYKALAAPLYITSIRHALRNDGDYQFEVSTTRGTDVMMQRFAQLLSFGK